MQLKYIFTATLMYNAVLLSFALRGILFAHNAHKILSKQRQITASA